MVTEALYRSYALSMKVLGFEKSISRFVGNLGLDHPKDAAILDVGCGTGIIGIALMKDRPKSTLVATDVSDSLLEQTKRNAVEQGIDESRVTLGLSDISTPEIVKPVNGPAKDLVLKSFDVVSTGAAIGYASDQVRTIKTLLSMVKPGGWFVNIEMNEKLFGRHTARRYNYAMMPLSRMERVVADSGFEISRIPIRDFPARLTRVGYIARKK